MADERLPTLDQLLAVQKERELFITKLSEPIVAQFEQQQSHNGARSSDVSSAADATNNTTPASLSADLEHYKELFTKLRFSYVEQTTKEKFLRAVVGEPPIHVTAAENAELEAHLATVKATLKSRKAEVADLVADLERQCRELSRRNEKFQEDMVTLQALPAQISELQQKLESLQESQMPELENAEYNVPLPELLAMIKERSMEGEALDQQNTIYENELERKAEQLRQLQGELKPLENRRKDVAAAAGDASQRKDRGVNDILEDKGRWLRGVEATMTALLEVDA